MKSLQSTHCIMAIIVCNSWMTLVILVVSAVNISGFYVPGVAPTDFRKGDKITVKSIKMTSSKTQLPYEYYSLPFCLPKVRSISIFICCYFEAFCSTKLQNFFHADAFFEKWKGSYNIKNRYVLTVLHLRNMELCNAVQCQKHLILFSSCLDFLLISSNYCY